MAKKVVTSYAFCLWPWKSEFKKFLPRWQYCDWCKHRAAVSSRLARLVFFKGETMGSNPNSRLCLAKIMNFPFTFKSNFLGGQLSSWSLLNVNRRNFHWNSPFCELLWTFRTWKLASNWEVEFKSEPLCDLNLASIISGLMPTNSVKLHFGHGFGSKLAQIGLPKNRIKMNFPDIFGVTFLIEFLYHIEIWYKGDIYTCVS